ncbi:MAG: ATP-dependent DNA ligase [Desulfurococcales archaeon]|nr:ATP-dependent DNA ligase [Desulfurococcales archaeon]
MGSSGSNDLEFKYVAETFAALERITSRTQLAVLLAKLFKRTPPAVMDKVVYLIQGRLLPDWKGAPELGVGEKLLIKAIAQAYKVSESRVERMFKSLGDLGLVAEKLADEARSKAARSPGLLAFMAGGGGGGLTVSRVYNDLLRVAYAQGEGSRDIKLKLVAGLLVDATPLEAKYIVRFIEGRLRLGVGDATVLDALALAFGGGAHSRPIIERAYNLRADLGYIARLVAERGVDYLRDIKPEVGIPLRPMLAERGKDPGEILRKVGGRAIAEYKYDGERAQIHKKGDRIIIYSRRLEDITRMYPDVVEMARAGIKAEEAIVEGEIVAIDPETGELRPFQVLMHRKRKHDIYKVMKEVPVAVYLFDAIYVDGEDLTRKPLPERRKALESIIVESEYWRLAKAIETSSPEELWKFFLQAIEEGAEGIMIKAVHRESYYTAGVRGWLWVKLKRDYKSEMTDTVDLVVVGAFYGKGKRGGKLSSLLMAAYDPDRDMFVTVCKVATGFTDEELDKMNEMLKKYIIPRRHPRVESRLEPDVWVEPALVAEILGAELTLSPMHTCCLGAVRPGVGISIRFPRFIRWRDDKRPEDATTTHELLEMYRRQLRRVEEAVPAEA